MKGQEFQFNGEDGSIISGIRWIPEGPLRAVMIINHGMAEHIARYESFALFLNESGIAVWGEDHRGHGKTAASMDELGYFHQSQGWEKVLSDISVLTDLVKKEHPELPLFILGHSMGSFLTRDFLCENGSDFTGAIISGTGYTPAGLCRTMNLLASGEAKLRGDRHRSAFLDNLSFGQFNRSFLPNRTPFDWLSRDENQVDEYIQDDLCGFICTSAFFRDLSRGLMRIIDRKRVAGTPRELPVFFYSGTEDPVGGRKAGGVDKVVSLYRSQGMENISCRLNDGGRHESLNEINRDEVFRHFLDFIEENLPS